MEGLLKEAKAKKVWHEYWGKSAFTVKIPGQDNTADEKQHYQEMVMAGKAINMSMGQVTLSGNINIDLRFKLTRSYTKTVDLSI
jgi:hypothetical protein